MKKRLARISNVNLLSFILLGVIKILNWSPLLFLISLGMAVVTLIIGLISLFQRKNLENYSNLHGKLLWEIMWNLFVSVGLILISVLYYLYK